MVMVIQRDLKLKLDMERTLMMAIVHDIGESITGDIDVRLIHRNKISRKKKDSDEHAACERIGNMIDQGPLVYNLWKEYEEGVTPEARFVKAVDKIETFFHYLETAIRHGPKLFDAPDLTATYADKAVAKVPELIPLLASLKRSLREQFRKAGIPWKEEYNFTLDHRT